MATTLTRKINSFGRQLNELGGSLSLSPDDTSCFLSWGESTRINKGGVHSRPSSQPAHAGVEVTVLQWRKLIIS